MNLTGRVDLLRGSGGGGSSISTIEGADLGKGGVEELSEGVGVS